ncbi:MAG: T9SS type A sorting domain-containing protein [Crocinitomicaceae bacterium]|nr:T9SS type A sorting domain-containing protein [Crocinitomicaceae bacterium]MCF8444930.1 T9SS type A sorting domain-containing protein [Crocinitomicaceae bacterium]
MKKILTILFFSASVAYGQNTVTVSQVEYQEMKQAGLIDPNANYSFSDLAFPSNIKYNGGIEKNGTCDCIVPLDSTFSLAMSPNDDGSSGLINLPFTFDFYGNQYNSVYINNNGNISFVSPYMTWTSNSFPDSSYNMIAPFWGDVDTRGGMDSLGNLLGNGGNVWYKVTPTALIINWNQVGYFNMHNDLVSTFQLIISNGTDSLVSAGGNVSFCYEDMQWTTGDASSGIGGFGGTPATVGVNVGNGTDYFQVGQFVQSGTSFDGPTNNFDGVDFLDGQEIYFNVAGISATNTPPLLISSALCDTINVLTGDTLKSMNSSDFIIGIMTPEIGQNIQISTNSDAPTGAFSYSMTPISDQYYEIQASFNATGVTPGIYHVSLTATDNGTPVGVTTKNFVFEVIYENSANIGEFNNSEIKIYPNPTNDFVTIQVPKNFENNQVEILDLSGKILFSKTLSESALLDLSHLSAGTYFIRIIQDQQVLGINRIIKR